jgi:PHD/YefM family antitoxin component YafN of YafNO toxin-antitoxin module
VLDDVRASSITRVIRTFGVLIVRVTTAEFIKGYGTLADKALTKPVTITKNGRDRLILVSADEYARLKRRDRRTILPEELTEEEITAIAAAEMHPRHDHLNEEVRGRENSISKFPCRIWPGLSP